MVYYELRTSDCSAPFTTRRLKARTTEEAMAEAALAVLLDPTVTYVLRRVASRVVGRYSPVAELVKEWEGG